MQQQQQQRQHRQHNQPQQHHQQQPKNRTQHPTSSAVAVESSRPGWRFEPVSDLSNRSLEKYLESSDTLPSEDNIELRRKVVETLEKIVKSWVKKVAWQRGVEKSLIEKTNAKIFTFGSYRLEVYGPEADIDALCVGPCYITQQVDFFIVLYDMLGNIPDVTELHAIPNAHVPLIRFRLSGIPIDLLYARLSVSVIPEDLDISNQDVIRGIDEKTILSLNGCRGTEQILRLIPNLKNFRTALRLIKLWAKRRGVYSHMVGFLGGVHWALLMAYICQLFPDAMPGVLVAKFFKIYSRWNWSNPVILCPIGSRVQISSWDQEQIPYMSIINPADPYTNASHNVTKSTLEILKEEFQRGATMWKTREMLNEHEWAMLCEPYPFFNAYNDFLRITLSAADADDLQLWKGWVESRFRQLIAKIESYSGGLLEVHPNPCAFRDDTTSTAECMFFWGLCWKRGQFADGELPIDVPSLAAEFRRNVFTPVSRKPGRRVQIYHIARNFIPHFCSDSDVHFVQRFRRHRPQVVPPRFLRPSYLATIGLISSENVSESE